MSANMKKKMCLFAGNIVTPSPSFLLTVLWVWKVGVWIPGGSSQRQKNWHLLLPCLAFTIQDLYNVG